MHGCALFRSAILFLWLTAAAAAAQQFESGATVSKPRQQSATARQSAMSLIEEALAGTGSLTLPSNRLAIELRAFPIVWSRSDARARVLVQQMAGEFGQSASAILQNPDQNPVYALNLLRNQRNNIAHNIANSDPALALVFVSATLPYLKSDGADGDSEDHALIVDLAAQVALRDPHHALQLAEQQLKEMSDLPQSMISLLEQVQRNDPQAGARLLRDIVDHLRQQNLAEDSEALSFASALLGNQFFHQSEAGKPDDALRSLAEAVASAAMNSEVMQNEPYILANAKTALQALSPSKSAILYPGSPRKAVPPIQPSFWQRFNLARSNGDVNQALALISQAPEDDRAQALEQAAWDLANRGEVERARQVAETLDPWKKNNVVQSAIQCAALAAGSHSDFSGARQLAAQITDEDSRATLLSDLAIYAYGDGKRSTAEEMLAEAASLVSNRNAGTSAFAAQLRVAQAYLRVKPAQAIPLLERSASQIDQALSAAAQLDGFLPDRHSFEGSELILDQGFLYTSLLEPYAQATAELAAIDLPTARTMADRLPLPEARLMTEVVVAARVLGQKDQAQAASNSAPDVSRWFDVH